MTEAETQASSEDASGVGSVLRAAREAQGLTLAEVAGRTRIPTRHLATIEAGGHDGLPAATYSAGFVKTYARLLGLDATALSHRFRGELAYSEPATQRYEPYEPADPARTPSRLLAWSMLAVFVLAVVGYLYWRGTTAEDPIALAAGSGDRPAAPPSSGPPVAAGAIPLADANAATLLTAESPVWIKVYEMGGATLFMGLMKPGEHYAVPVGATDPRLLTGRPTALHVTVGDTVIPPLGAPERRIKDVSLKPAALLRRAAATGEPPIPVAASAAPVPLPPGAPTAVENSAAAQ